MHNHNTVQFLLHCGAFVDEAHVTISYVDETTNKAPNLDRITMHGITHTTSNAALTSE